jgi:hypothetical protein
MADENDDTAGDDVGRELWAEMASQPVQLVWDEGSPTVSARVLAEGDTPMLDFEVSRETGRPVAVTIRKHEGVLSSDIRLPLESLLERVEVVIRRSGIPMQQRVRRRPPTPLTEEFLRSVADAYRGASAGERIRGVKDVHPASDSQVYRWLKAARERGILEAEDGD